MSARRVTWVIVDYLEGVMVAMRSGLLYQHFTTVIRLCFISVFFFFNRILDLKKVRDRKKERRRRRGRKRQRKVRPFINFSISFICQQDVILIPDFSFPSPFSCPPQFQHKLWKTLVDLFVCAFSCFHPFNSCFTAVEKEFRSARC